MGPAWRTTGLAPGRCGHQHAKEIQVRRDIEGVDVPEHIRDFVETYTSRSKQLSLRLA
jgi:hypothetical protein